MAAKKIENKNTSLKINDNNVEREMTYFDLIKVCLNTIPPGGFSRKDIRERDEIESKLIGNETELNHELFISMRKICNDMKWNSRHKDIQDFLEYLDDVK